MTNKQIIRVKTITEGHRLQMLPKPAHPLISIVDLKDMKPHNFAGVNVVMDFYIISLKKDDLKMPYGHQEYDYNEGVMGFIAPNQILTGPPTAPRSDREGWMLFIHPDFLWNTPLAKKIKQYEFFDYAINEALFLSDKEEIIINGIIESIKNEYNSNIDKFSQDIIISHLETLLNYSERFYQRQFITRKITNTKLLNRLEDIVTNYFATTDLISKGLPTVQYIAENLNISTKYLSSMLKQTTGLTTQQHIHEKLIEMAKEKLSTTELSISEIAYSLGFEHPQSFSKLFKAKTNKSPLEFRQAFN
ncbi:helix-turn-helix domain-containing protein [Flavobacterium eburneipallidum]|uniref:helix-turn-helix domain-containing protein n=1 Tax=Flavobacterium eburneipallidum TaxID=3003263 RepID=UPI002482D7B1|nr:helix-turn-helix transcriptional regulator [Flavobacterium eburneipallidum]